MAQFFRGFRHGAPFLIVIIPFAVLFGVVSREAGLAVSEALIFSAVVVAGAAQFTALQLVMDNAPMVIVIVSALAVNLRMVMYSAAMTPHFGPGPRWMRVLTAYLLVDQTFAQCSLEFERAPTLTLFEKFGYFMGNSAIVYPSWLAGTAVGSLLGAAIPADFGLEFALPIAFLSMIGPLLRTPAHIIAALTGAALSLICAGVPYNLGLILGGLGGMIAGAQVEQWQSKRTTP
ncbi:MAG: AzlC family ABC transporter permease [Paracoccaceae bacterium]